MKIIVAVMFLAFSAYSFGQNIPMFSYQCTSNATFLDDDYQTIGTDEKTAIVGYVRGSLKGLQEFKHSFDGHDYYAYASASISGFTYEDSSIEYAQTDYVLFEESIQSDLRARSLRESTFYAQNEELPKKYMMLLKDIRLNGIILRLKMKCSKME